MKVMSLAVLAAALFTTAAIAEDGPCTKCMTAARNKLASCQANAKTDDQKKACGTQLNSDIQGCKSVCPIK